MSFHLKNINDVFILNSSGKLGILNKNPEYELDINGSFYSSKLNGNNFSGYAFSGDSITGRFFFFNTVYVNSFKFENFYSSSIVSGYNILGDNFSGNSFKANQNITGNNFYIDSLKLNNISGNLTKAEDLSGLYIRLNTTGNNGIRGVSKPLTNLDTIINTDTGYFSQTEFESFVSQYNNLPISKTFASGAGTGDYWFDKDWITKFLELVDGNLVVSGHYSDRTTTISYLPIPKTIKFLICKCSGSIDKTGCRENNEPIICWDTCIKSGNPGINVGDCKYLLETGVNIFNIQSMEASYESADGSRTNFINSFNTGRTLIFEKTFHQFYPTKSPSIIFSPQDYITSKIFYENLVWMDSNTGKAQFYCEGSGCFNYDFETSYGSFDKYPFYRFSYITMA
jgi:hypothetical protein